MKKTILILLMLTTMMLAVVSADRIIVSGNDIFLNETFSRSDSGTVGNGWSESEDGGTTAEILNQELKLTDNNSSGNVVVDKAISLSPTPTRVMYFFDIKVSDASKNVSFEADDGGIHLFTFQIADGYFELEGVQGSAVSDDTWYEIFIMEDRPK